MATFTFTLHWHIHRCRSEGQVRWHGSRSNDSAQMCNFSDIRSTVVHRIRVVLHRQQQQLELPEARSWAAPWKGRRYSISEQAVQSRKLFTWRANPCLPFVTAVMTDGCVHLLYNSSWKGNRYGTARQAVRPVHYSTNHTWRVTVPQLSYTGRRVGPALHDNARSLVLYRPPIKVQLTAPLRSPLAVWYGIIILPRSQAPSRYIIYLPELKRKFENLSVRRQSTIESKKTLQWKRLSCECPFLKFISHYAGCVCFHPVNSKLTPAVRTPFKAKCWDPGDAAG
jgi:hypothetical protein